ncbi:MAG TPA: APC family permease [Acidimicrobiia bacterium]|nr:APC family permease [Acidimicrobiia bacterium]
MSLLKRLLVGRPLPSAEEEHRRILKIVGLAVFSSDAISSTAYATEEILHVLVPRAGMEALENLIPISLVVIVLLAIVGLSYRQTIFAYPQGGGSYTVSRENLGTGPSLVAAGSMLTDYILTVAVSISAGVAAITSAVPELREHRVGLGLALIGLITLANLRGLKEAGTIFAAPTYLYILSLGGLVLYGLFRSFTGSLDPLPVNEEHLAAYTPASGVFAGVTIIALMRAFSSGAVALTGVEAISIAVPTFKPPAAKNAAKTLVAMIAILGSFFFGISVLAHRVRPTLSEGETILSILGDAVFGRGSIAYILLQASTAAILILAANTAYTAFPTMCSIIARDGYLPRQLFNRGDRLVFSNGVLVLALAAAGLLIGFGGVTTALIPLYAVGVFTSFTLSQTGMVRYHLKKRLPGWRARAFTNGAGAATTGIVLTVVLVSKFTIGAWIPVVLIPTLIMLFRGIRRHYDRVVERLSIPPGWRPARLNHTVVVLVGGVHRGVLEALAYAKSLNPDHLVAVTVVSDEDEQERIEKQWARHDLSDPLDIIYSPYRELSRPILRFLDEIDTRWANDVVTVLIPEVVVRRWWEQLLHNQSALFLKGRLLFRKGLVVTSVPYHLD